MLMLLKDDRRDRLVGGRGEEKAVSVVVEPNCRAMRSVSSNAVDMESSSLFRRLRDSGMNRVGVLVLLVDGITGESTCATFFKRGLLARRILRRD